MDTSKVETKAVAYVQDVLSNCPLLAASDIKIGDKEMSLDGSVRIHNTDNHTKHNLRGRVFVQVKGRTVGNISKETISYQAEVSDLRNYLQDGGAIYIVVYFGPNNARKIYYETLTVVKLKQYLSKVKSTQRKKSISLRALPTDTNDIETIFLNFYNDSMNQKGFANAHISSLTEQVPPLDGIVHSAGIGHRLPCKMITGKDVDEVLGVNFKSAVLLQAELLRGKKIKKSSSIVFIASRAAASPSVGNALYSASKGAIISYAKCLSLELAPRQVRVNCICPAMVWTDLILQGGLTREDLEKEQQKYPLKRYGRPEDISGLAVYLLSDVSSWMTGSCVDITGGGE